MLTLTSALSLGCAIEDGTAFGLPYSIAASPEPAISAAGDVVFTATYSSPCAGGGSEFEVTRFVGDNPDEDASHQFLLQESAMLVGARQPPSCTNPLPFEQEVTVEVSTPLPADLNAATKFLACPPGSKYEMVKLGAARAAASASGAPSFMSATAARQRVVIEPTQQPVPMQQPSDWDEEEDGVWQAPVKENASEAVEEGVRHAVDAPGSASTAAAAATAASA